MTERQFKSLATQVKYGVVRCEEYDDIPFTFTETGIKRDYLLEYAKIDYQDLDASKFKVFKDVPVRDWDIYDIYDY